MGIEKTLNLKGFRLNLGRNIYLSDLNYKISQYYSQLFISLEIYLLESSNNKKDNIFIVADFNLPDFETDGLDKRKALIDFCSLNNLKQYN